MRSQKLIDLESRLLDPLPIPVIGQCLQKKAVIALSKDRSPEAVKLLAKALTRLKEQEIKESVLDVLSNLKNQNCIDAVCEVWADTRHRDLVNLLVEKGWIASKPIDLRVITALKIDRLEIIMDGSEKTIEPLLNAFQDKDSEIANRASKCAIIFDKPEYQEFICRLVIEQDHPIARQVAIKAQYSPNETSQKALFYFFIEQWDKYKSLDAELSFLQKLFERGNRELKQRIAEQIKKANRAELLKIITGKNQERKLEEITDTEWETILFVLNSNKQWNTIWQLARKAPTIWVKSLLQTLDKAKWSPETEEEQIDFVRLKQLNKKCSEQLSMMGGLTVCQTILKTSNTRSLFSPDGKLLVTYFAGETILWQMPDGKPISTLSALDDNNSVSVSQVSFSSDGQLLAGSNYGHNKILLWQMPEGQLISTKACHNEKQAFRALAFSPNEKMLATGGSDTVIKLWQMPEGKLISTLNSSINPIYHLAFSPDGKTLIGYGERESLIGLWRMPEGKLISTLNSSPQKINKVVFSPDSQLLASSGIQVTNREIKLWRTRDGQLVKTIDDLDELTDPFSNIQVLEFSPDGQILAGGSSSKCKSIMLWRIPDGKLIKNIDGFDNDDSPWSMDFSPDSKIIASGSFEGTIKLFQIPDGEHIATLLYRNRSKYDDERDGICHINFSPDGQILVSCSTDGVVKLWKSDLSRLVNIPVSNLNPQDKRFIKKVLSSNKCTQEEKHWLEFIQALTSQS